jgi:hypothetical protein
VNVLQHNCPDFYVEEVSPICLSPSVKNVRNIPPGLEFVARLGFDYRIYYPTNGRPFPLHGDRMLRLGLDPLNAHGYLELRRSRYHGTSEIRLADFVVFYGLIEPPLQTGRRRRGPRPQDACSEKQRFQVSGGHDLPLNFR